MKALYLKRREKERERFFFYLIIYNILRGKWRKNIKRNLTKQIAIVRFAILKYWLEENNDLLKKRERERKREYVMTNIRVISSNRIIKLEVFKREENII